MIDRLITIAGTTRRFTVPPKVAIDIAVEWARRSPCAKSARGVAVYDRVTSEVYGAGFNGPPGRLARLGSAECRNACGKLCVHAEVRALRGALVASSHARREPIYLDAVHVKVVDGQLVAGGGPSCWQCSREVLDVGLGGFWLFEAPPTTCPDEECVGVDCQYLHDTWRYYTAAEFHAATLAACELPPAVAR